MPRKVERRFNEPEEERLNRQVYEPPRPGRPPNERPASGSVVVTLTLLRELWQALGQAALALDSGPVKTRATNALGALHLRIGDALDDTDRPPKAGRRGRAPGCYEITWTDDTTQRFATRAAAARALGIQPASLSVAMSKGEGVYRKSVYVRQAGQKLPITCRRVEASAVPDSSDGS